MITLERATQFEPIFKIFSDVSSDIADFKEEAIPAILSRIMTAESYLISADGNPICVCWIRKLEEDTAILGFIYSNEFMKNQGKGITYVLRDKLRERAAEFKKFQIHSLLSHAKSRSWYGSMGFNDTGRTYNDGQGNVITVFERIN